MLQQDPKHLLLLPPCEDALLTVSDRSSQRWYGIRESISAGLTGTNKSPVSLRIDGGLNSTDHQSTSILFWAFLPQHSTTIFSQVLLPQCSKYCHILMKTDYRYLITLSSSHTWQHLFEQLRRICCTVLPTPW